MPGVVAPLPHGKSNHFGIEVAEKVVWQGWEPGREYTKNLTLKNVKVKTQKLKYRGPQSRFFSTLYPQPIVLSAGTSYTLPVTFRPLEKVTYDDKVEFDLNTGSTFSVPICAVLPQLNITVPPHLDFSMCATRDLRQMTFDINNVSELETPYQIVCEAPFQVCPPEGSLEPFSTVTVTVTFSPQAAVVYESDTVIKYGPEFNNSKITRFEGIGKYPHLLVAGSGSQPGASGAMETVVNYGSVGVGRTQDKWIELHNLAPVNAPFSVEHPTNGPGQLDAVFTCLQREGVVPANSSCRIPISYSPNMVGAKNVDYFHVKAIGNISKTVVTCVGNSTGPDVQLSHSILNYLQIDSGQTATKAIDIVNHSDTEAVFQFQVDCSESVFKFEHVSGTLPPGSKRTIIVQFSPQHAINYYRKVACLVHNQNPLFLELLGTCHTETSKPAVLQAKHLARYKAHVERGLSFTPPEQLNEQVQEGKLKIDDNGFLHKDEEMKELSGSPQTTSPPALHPMDEYFNDGYYSAVTHFPPHVSLDLHQVDFGRCADARSAGKQTVNVTNHTNGKVTVVWMGDESHIFSVTPLTLDLPPQGSSSFSVSFKPSCPNQFFGAELECFASYKSLRDYRLVEDTTHCPPWCLTLQATGHTFQPHNETFLPRYILDSPQLTFPAVNAHEEAYRTLLLANTGTTPVMFDLDNDAEGIFSLKPTKGLLPAGQSQMFVVKCLPKAVRMYKSVLKLHLNADDKHDQDLTLLGSAETADILLGDEGDLYFKPTCVGAASTRAYPVQNVSRIPLYYEWKMTAGDSKLLSVEPATGLIQPNENQLHQWSFTPTTEDNFLMRPTLVVWGQGRSSLTSGGKKRQFPVRALGNGTVGHITCEDTYLQFGNIVVGSVATQTITIVNDSMCNLDYRLEVDQEIDGLLPEDDASSDPLALILEKSGGMLPARSREVIRCTAQPSRRTCYRWSVNYRICTQNAADLSPALTEPQRLCDVLATGVFPTMSVTDAHCYGSAMGVSKKQLWGLFSLDSLNVALDADPSSTELMYTVSTRQSHQRKAPVYTRAILDFNFGAAPVNSDPCMVQLMVENTGAVPCEWSFLFPNDLQLELEYWAETGDFDEEELHQLKVMDNKLFTIEPKSGRLTPGESQTVTLTYNHFMPGTDRLPVLLKLARGREILLNLVGVSVESDRRYLHFPDTSHMFTPVPIGETAPPAQVYEMSNGGALPVKYEMDLLPLEMLKQENYDHAVFEVLNPMGEILPGQTAAVEWKFSPLEAKTYMVDIPIHVHNGDTAIITFTGVGYDKRALGAAMTVTDGHETCGVPSVQAVALPGQLCFLSQERLTFGNVPLFTRPRRVVVVSNKSTEHGVMYHWHVTERKDAKIVSIYPRTGRLPPGGSQLCQATFTSCGHPQFYDVDLVCEVFNLTDYTAYENGVEDWESEKRRQKVEFSITKEDTIVNLTEFQRYERDLTTWTREQQRQSDEFTVTDRDSATSQGVSSSAGGRASQSRSAVSVRLQSLDEPAARTPSPDVDFTKYKTLPPIRQDNVDLTMAKKRADKRLADRLWPRPEKPRPFLLHLGVTARSHEVATFQQNFPEEFETFCIDRTLSDDKVDPKPSSLTPRTVTPQPITCLAAEADLVAGAISNILRGLLDDTQFQDSCKKVVEAPIPYFKQFTARAKSAPPPVTSAIEEDNTPPQETSPLQSARSETYQSQASRVESVQSEASRAETSQSEQGAGLVDDLEAELHKLGITSRISSAAASESPLFAAAGPTDGASARPPSNIDDIKFTEKQTLKKLPELSNTVESLLENTLSNILNEAFGGDFNITSRPRLIALPPKPGSGGTHRK